MYAEIESRIDVPQSATLPHRTLPIADASPRRAGGKCSSCAMKRICMPPDLSADELARLDSVVYTTRVVKRGETLYRTGDGFHSIYAVRAGCFKTVLMHRDGQEQVTGFQLAGDALGLDGVYSDRHDCDAVALEDSIVCIIPFDLLELLCREVKSIQHHVHRLMSGEIVRESGLMMLLGTMTAEQRVAAFLLNLSSRLKARGYSPDEFVLRMTREEIGSYLGLKLETVSRTLSKFRKAGVLRTHGKEIRIADHARLAKV
ncbi:transcriptional regulator, Crp/Fnr family [Caballeronia glathei]|uniref:Crp/Fnr family transcriptional regulator n=1 Tax=Caballeronia glathei TaxID=60547 RepID=A0A069PDC5_9BURK|nr:fumarate/nitrate reduction transcriptional regulator Fnr [Caballeronia glathei]KDR38678.1 Crp/Fnr family transcriptional regulator [Caballeronia glathei]CDY79161.1 transcriptional regulator, Crp/Fnr family [Caballeronia glathei]